MEIGFGRIDYGAFCEAFTVLISLLASVGIECVIVLFTVIEVVIGDESLVSEGCFVADNLAAFFLDDIAKLRVTESDNTLCVAADLIIISVTYDDGHNVFAILKIIGDIVFHTVDAEGHIVVEFIDELLQISPFIAGGVGYEQIVADLFAVDIKLEETETADCDFSLFALFCGEYFSEKGSVTSVADNPFCVFENLFVFHFYSSCSNSVSLAFHSSHSSIRESCSAVRDSIFSVYSITLW